MMMRNRDSCWSVHGTVFCHMDAAVLCTSCDPAANRILHRHHQVPVVEVVNQEEEDDGNGSGCTYEALFGDHEVDEYLDLGEFNNSCGDEKGVLSLSVKDEVSEGVGVVPVVPSEALGFDYSSSMRHVANLICRLQPT